MGSGFRKILLVIVLVIGLCAVFVKLYNAEWGNAQKTIYFVPKTLPSMEFWQVMKQGVDAAAKEFGVNVEVAFTETETDIEGQIQILQDAMSAKPAAIILAATDYKRIVPVARHIVDEKIELVLVDSAISEKIASSLVGTNNYEAGKKLGQAFIDLADRGSTVAVVNFTYGSESTMERERGVMDRLHEAGGIDIIGPLYSEGSEEVAYTITHDLLQSNPNVDAVIGLNEPSTVGVARAVKEHKTADRDIKVVGFDSSMEEIAFLEEGIIQAIVVQKPFNMGYLAVKTAMEVIAGQAVNETIDTGSEVITIDNMYTRENQKLLFPFIEK